MRTWGVRLVTEQSVLYRYRFREATLAETLELAPAGSRILAYTPTACVFAFRHELSEDRLYSAYEVRLFDQTCEVRWVDAHGAVVLADSDISAKFGDWTTEPEQVKAWRLPRRYVLWGRMKEAGRLFDHQIGSMDVPWKKLEQGRLALSAYEYLAVEDRFGNVVVVAERLAGLEKVEEV